MAGPVSSFYATVGIQTRVADLRRVDRYLALIEKKMAKMTANLQKSMGNVKLPPLTVKKVKIDELAAQRAAQTSLNRIGRLLELKVGNVRLDADKIERQVSNVLTRASSKARMNIRTVLGTSGGANIHYPGAGYAPRNIPHLPSVPSVSQFGDAFGGGSMGAGLGGFIPRIGAGGLIAGGIVGAGYMGVQQVSQAKDMITEREQQRLKLELSTGGSRQMRDSVVAAYLDLNNALGVKAETGIDSFSKFMKQARSSMKLNEQQSFDLYKNMAVATRGTGGDEQSVQRQAYALQQIGGLGHLRAEELNQQIADSAPVMRSFIIKAWEERTGAKGVDAFLKAMSKREVSFNDVMRGYELAAYSAKDSVRELADTIAGEQARLANMKLSEELERSKGAMSSSARAFAESQQELHKATEPLRDAFYSAAAAGTSMAARFISLSAKTLEKAPAMRNETSNEQRSTAPLASSTGRGLLGVPDTRRLLHPRYPLNAPSPLLNQTKPWQVAAEAVYQPESLDQMVSRIQSNTTNVTSTRSITVEPGAFQIQTQAQDAEALALELEPAMRRVFDEALDDQLTETNISFGSK